MVFSAIKVVIGFLVEDGEDKRKGIKLVEDLVVKRKGIKVLTVEKFKERREEVLTGLDEEFK